jgi:hypothetical protein
MEKTQYIHPYFCFKEQSLMEEALFSEALQWKHWKEEEEK